jgi:aminoglycoside phosphotransferase family enzyme/predicted kinase
MSTLIEALREPECYPHPVQTVVVKQTHISWVLLAGEYAYKIKKPVRYGFVDFSSLERRRQACEDELRLNRRFAPALYVDIVPIHGTAAQPTFDADSAPIEYAVRLRRFATDQELVALLARDAVTREELSAFGQRLAQLHEDCPVYGVPGMAQRSLATVSANLDELLGEVSSARPGRADGLEPLDAVARWLRDRAAACAALLDRRAAQGRVRECHGDLHAGNVVRFEDRLIAFDCLEFDVSLRRIDVLDDAAFLFMDLVARDRRDLAYAFLNGWLEQAGDYDALGLLAVFFVHRALVRFKVHRLGGEPLEARRYLGAAHAFAQGSRAVLVLTCGLSGSGKTWLSERAMAEAGAIRIRSDVERKRMAGLQAGQSSARAGVDLYTLAFNDRVYEHLRHLAGELLCAGQSVIVDAAFLKQAERHSFIALARELDAPVLMLHCVAPQEELGRRLSERQRAGTDASEADETVMRRQVHAWEPFTDEERAMVIEVDTREDGATARVAATIDSLQAQTRPEGAAAGPPCSNRSE